MIADLGREPGRVEAGVGDGEELFLAKGLFRHRGPVWAGAPMAKAKAMLCVFQCSSRSDGRQRIMRRTIKNVENKTP